jgi:hypothetical protein
MYLTLSVLKLNILEMHSSLESAYMKWDATPLRTAVETTLCVCGDIREVFSQI